MAQLPSAFIPLTEAPPGMNLIKRALISYETVVLPAPDERDAVAKAFHSFQFRSLEPALGEHFPIGKVANYDMDYERVHRALSPARKAGIVKTFHDPHISNESLGKYAINVGPGGYSLPVFTPGMLRDPEFMQAARRGAHVPADVEDWEELAPAGRISEFMEEVINPAERLAIARLSMTHKLAANASMQDASILTEDAGIAEITRILQARAIDDRGTGDAASGTNEAFSSIESLIFSEYVKETALARMSVHDILRLRTRAWGKEGAARIRLFRMVARLAEECRDSKSLKARIRAEIDTYRNAATDLSAERQKMGWRSFATLATGVTLPTLANTSGLVTAAVAHAFLNPAGAIMASIGTAGALALAVGPTASDFWAKRKKFERLAGFALLTPYEPFAK
jgi:hypothetical protein